MRSRFIVIQMDKSFCPKCRERVSLLGDKTATPGVPAFFICWTCQTVAQVGVGPCKPMGEKLPERKKRALPLSS